MNVWVCR